jgi:hypothetical protein
VDSETRLYVGPPTIVSSSEMSSPVIGAEQTVSLPERRRVDDSELLNWQARAGEVAAKIMCKSQGLSTYTVMFPPVSPLPASAS